MPAPLEPGRAPDAPTLDVPPASVTEPVFPPKKEIFLPPGRFEPPPQVLIVPPPPIREPPPPPPCPPGHKDCPKPPPPPEVPEPSTLLIFLVGALALWVGLRGRTRPRGKT